jgi:hypothetical protein
MGSAIWFPPFCIERDLPEYLITRREEAVA